MFCSHCGAQNADNTAFCSNCGANLTQPTATPVNGQPAGYPAAAGSIPGKGLGIASMVLGIIALVMFCTGWFAMICALVGVVLGGIALKKAKDAGMKNGMAVAGLVCSIVALAIDVMVYIWAVSTVNSILSRF